MVLIVPHVAALELGPFDLGQVEAPHYRRHLAIAARSVRKDDVEQ